MAFDPDAPNPADDAIVASHPANERASRLAIEGMFDIEHFHETGRHKFPGGSLAARDAIVDWQKHSLWMNTDTSPATMQIQINPAAPFSWVTIGPTASAGTFPAGTNMIFVQLTPPSGWTQDVSANDRVFRIVSTASEGGLLGGSWVISGSTVGDTTLTVAQMPAHTHTVDALFPSGGSNVTAGGGSEKFGGSSAAAGSGDPHTHGIVHDGLWRPLYRNVISATKD